MRYLTKYEYFLNFYPGDCIEINDNKRNTFAKIIETSNSILEKLKKKKGNLTYDEFLQKEKDEETNRLLSILDDISDTNRSSLFIEKINGEKCWIIKDIVIRKLTSDETKNYDLLKSTLKYNI